MDGAFEEIFYHFMYLYSKLLNF